MDDTEKAVLRRRKQTLSEAIDASDELLLADLRSSGLVTDEGLRMIQLERTNEAKVSRLVDLLLTSRSKDAFSALCAVLSRTTYKWMSADLVLDLRVERGQVQADPLTLEETAILVHRKFGTSKRFSEADKRDMAEMIAVKLQVARGDEWGKESNRVKDALASERAAYQTKEELALSITALQRDFVRRHERQLVSHAHDMTTTRQLINQILSNPSATTDVLFQFKQNLDQFLHQMAAALNQRDALFYEKEKCLALLGIKVKDTPKVALDDVIGRVTGMAVVGTDMKVVDKDEVIRRLERRVEELEKRKAMQAEGERELQRKLGERDREMSKLRQMVHIK